MFLNSFPQALYFSKVSDLNVHIQKFDSNAWVQKFGFKFLGLKGYF